MCNTHIFLNKPIFFGKFLSQVSRYWMLKIITCQNVDMWPNYPICHMWRISTHHNPQIKLYYTTWGSHTGGYPEIYLLACNAMRYAESTEVSEACVASIFRLWQSRNQYEAGSKQRKTEAIRSSETSVDFQRNTRRYIPEDRYTQKQF
jgi:hypothetical protein